MNTLRILVIEDDPHVCSLIKRTLAHEKDIRIVGLARTKREAEKLIESYSFETLLMDMTLPDGLGLDTIARVSERYPEADIMVLADELSDPHIVSAIEAGATGYILKRDIESALATAIRLLEAGGSSVSSLMAKSVLRALCAHTAAKTVKSDPHTEINPLSERETEILRLLAKGMSFSEIGEILAISTHTVTAHIKKIYRKLDVHSRSEAVYEAAQMGLI